MTYVRVLVVLGMLTAVPAAVGCADDDDGSVASGRPASDAAVGDQPGTLNISGSVTVSVAHRTIVTLSGASDSVALPDLQGVYRFGNLKSGDYVLTPSAFGYVFTPPTRAVTLTAADAEALDFAAIAENP